MVGTYIFTFPSSCLSFVLFLKQFLCNLFNYVKFGSTILQRYTNYLFIYINKLNS